MGSEEPPFERWPYGYHARQPDMSKNPPLTKASPHLDDSKPANESQQTAESDYDAREPGLGERLRTILGIIQLAGFRPDVEMMIVEELPSALELLDSQSAEIARSHRIRDGLEKTVEVNARAVVAANARIEKLEAALRKIASCEKRADGDLVDIARQALANTEKGVRDGL